MPAKLVRLNLAFTMCRHPLLNLPMKKLLSYLLPFVAIFVIGALMQWYDARSVPGQPTTSALMEEFNSLPVPTTNMPVDKLTVLNRGSAVRVVRHFQTAETPTSVLSYYERVLPGFGWQLVDTTQRSSAEPAIRFCRAGISLLIDAVPGSDATTYYVGISWAKRKNSNEYCPSLGADMKAN